MTSQAGETEKTSSLVSSYKGTLKISSGGPHLGTLSKSNHLPRALPPNAITLGVRASAYEFGGDTLSPKPVQVIFHALLQGRPGKQVFGIFIFFDDRKTLPRKMKIPLNIGRESRY